MGQSFTDTAGRDWTVAINVNAVKRVKAALSIDLLEAIKGPLIEDFVENPVLLCDTLFVLCQEQADAKGVDSEAFGKAMGGDALDHAVAAFLEALVGFSPGPRRALLTKTLTKIETIRRMGVEHANQVLEGDHFERETAARLAELAPPAATTTKRRTRKRRASATPGGSGS